jgi:rhodanese-related sulfurtransferase
MTTWWKISREALVLIFVATLIGSLFNLKLIREFHRGNLAPGFLEQNSYPGVTFITLDEAADLLANQRAIFIDSRSPAIYQAGHIPGALNLPYEHFEEYFQPELIPPHHPLVVYCEGGECRSSVALAQKLIAQGYPEVRVILEGWSGWQSAGLPVEVTSPEKK